MQTSHCLVSSSFVPTMDTGYFSPLIVDYLQGAENLKPFFEFPLSDEGLLKAIDQRKKSAVNRILLQEVISNQYQGLDLSEAADHNLTLLSLDNTFTVTSAHQPNLLTGYLYFFYKIIHSVKLAQHLKQISPENNFVPIFFIGSEDNDLEELGHFRFENQLFNWATEQTGAVGSMKVDAPLVQLLNELAQVLGPLGNHEQTLKQIIKKAYTTGHTITQATRILINSLLGHLGVLTIDANNKALKGGFKNIIKEEILQPKAYSLVSAQSSKLSEKYKAQAYFRPINFFYLKDQIRERIEFIDNEYLVLNTNIKFTVEEMKTEIDTHPERFSPNVILRGIYQESILPNIAFIGGGSEVAYWMQLKTAFEHYNVFYPVIVLRQSALIMDQKTWEQQEKTGLSDAAMFPKTDQLIAQLVQNTKEESWNIDPYQKEMEQWETALLEQFQALDKNLVQSISAAMSKVKHQFGIIDKKINRAIKKKETICIDKIISLKEHAFPKDGLQERYDTFMPYYLNYGPQIFQDILNSTTLFGEQFLILKYKN